jgi:outer membrane protein TolC
LLAALALAVTAGAQAGELGEVLHGALNHPAIAAQRGQAEAANLQVESASARYFGAGTASADNATFENDRFLGVLNPSGFANPPFARNQFHYGASYSLPVDLFGVIAANRDAARQDLAVAELALRQETLLHLHDALTAYVQLQALQVQTAALAVQRQRVAVTAERVAAQVEAGALAASDLKLAQSELARVDAERVRLDGEREQALAALEEASGRHQLPAATATRVPPWQAAAVKELLPVRIATAREQSVAAQALAERRALWPALSAGADYFEYAGGGHGQETWSVGARLSLPLDLSAYRRAAGAEARAAAAHDDTTAAQRRTQSQLVALRAAYDAALADIAAVGTELDFREQLVAQQEELAKVGTQTVENGLRDERDRVEAQARQAQARVQASEAWSAAQVLNGVTPEAYIQALDTP